ncbi:MAG: 4-alpha-glucanotransferase [bacterium]|nr:4-alpha-glucanotransferase [bacterium]
MNGFAERRDAGIVLPLFSLRSGRDWGMGDIGDLPGLIRWMESAHVAAVQLLPIFEVPPGERSPYGGLSSFAIDPVYVAVDQLPEMADGLPAELRAGIAAVRDAGTIAYERVRALKQAGLRLAFERFGRRADAARTAAFAAFRVAHAEWLEPYALYRALRGAHGEAAWTAWPERLAAADPTALADLRTSLDQTVAFQAWVQWVAEEQWGAARGAARAAGVRLLGDVPFMVAADSADVWADQRAFRLDATVGAPPDYFDPEGQDWGLPAMRRDVMAEGGHAWWASRVRRLVELFDGGRIDHVVGYYRLWEIPRDGAPGFVPHDEGAQRAQGEDLLRLAMQVAGDADLLVEDLGSIPDFVRASLHDLGLPGFRVLRWERDDGRFRDPAAWPVCSVGTSGTHDTSTLRTWWEHELSPDEREALTQIPGLHGLDGRGAAFTPAIHEALLDVLYASRSALVLLPLPDAYGGGERINVPSTVQDTNWSYRMPWAVDDPTDELAAATAARLRRLAERHRRSPT